MWDDIVTRQSLRLLAQLIDYPAPGIVAAADECSTLLGLEDPDAAAIVREFARRASATRMGDLEEAYTATFELDPARSLYVGYHLYGETYRRSVFLLALKEHYREYGFGETEELADHLVVVLRFLADCPDPRMIAETIEEGVLPALDKLLGEDDEAAVEAEAQPHPADRRAYWSLLRALRLVLRHRAGSVTPPGLKEEPAHV